MESPPPEFGDLNNISIIRGNIGSNEELERKNISFVLFRYKSNKYHTFTKYLLQIRLLFRPPVMRFIQTRSGLNVSADPPNISISTDKNEYTTGDTMTLTFRLKNPGFSATNAYFIWGWNIPVYGFDTWLMVYTFNTTTRH